MTIKSFLSRLFYKKNLKNIMIFLIALIGLMLIFGNNNLVLSEGMTLQESQANMQKNNIIAAKKNNKYKGVEANYNETFSNIEPFDERKSAPTCGGQNNAQLVKGTDVNGFVNSACKQAQNTASKRESN